nr:hypothetical protein [Poseidonocella sp. HB161398]
MTQRLFPYGRPRGPLPVSLEQDGTALAIARINDLTRAGRANWFGLLAYLAFVTVTLLGVEDIDFFLDSRQTDLPLIGVSIPTASFFVAAPILGAALHVYLHLFVRKSTAALMVPQAEVNGTRLEAHILPWLLNDLVLRWRRDGAAEPRPLDLLATITAILRIWCAGPLALGYAWWRSWPAHDWVMSYSALACALFALHASLASWSRFLDDLGRRKGVLTWRHALAIAATLSAAIATLPLTHIKTVGGTFSPFDLAPAAKWMERLLGSGPDDRKLDLASADLTEAVLTPLPADWLPYDIHKRRFRIDWCAREGLDAETCGPPHFSDAEPVPHLLTLRRHWCAEEKRGLEAEACDAFFQRLDDRFPDAWATDAARNLGRSPAGPQRMPICAAPISAPPDCRRRTSAGRGWKGRTSAWRRWKGLTSAGRFWPEPGRPRLRWLARTLARA